MRTKVLLAALLSASFAIPPAGALAQSADPAGTVVAGEIQVEQARPRGPFAGLFKRRNRQPDAAAPPGEAEIGGGTGAIDLVPPDDVSAPGAERRLPDDRHCPLRDRSLVVLEASASEGAR